MLMRILVTGANGQLGTSLKYLSNNFKQYCLEFKDVNDLDITNYNETNNYISKNNFNVIINCAAYTAVDKAESEPEKAELINAKAVENLATISKKLTIYLIHLSTDYVFDGNNNKPYKEDDKTNPLSVYGKTKLKGEKALLQKAITGCIIRTSWLYGPYGHNFVKTILRIAKEKKHINVVNDQYGSPTYTNDLAATILTILPKLISKNSVNIYHYCNKGIITWYDFAKAIIKIADINCSVNNIKTREYPTAAIRPKYSALDTSKITTEFKLNIPEWYESLIKCINIINNKHLL